MKIAIYTNQNLILSLDKVKDEQDKNDNRHKIPIKNSPY